MGSALRPHPPHTQGNEMTTRNFIKLWYKGITPLEATCIAGAIHERQWDDFTHSRLDRCVFQFISYILKPY